LQRPAVHECDDIGLSHRHWRAEGFAYFLIGEHRVERLVAVPPAEMFEQMQDCYLPQVGIGSLSFGRSERQDIDNFIIQAQLVVLDQF